MAGEAYPIDAGVSPGADPLVRTPVARSSPAKTDRRTVRTRKAVLEAIVELLSHPDAGGEGITVTAVASAAGVSRRSVYLNFGSLEEAVVQAALLLLRSELPVPPAPGSKPPTGAELREMLLHLAEHLVRYRTFYVHALTGPSAYPVAGHIRETFVGYVQEHLAQRHEDVDEDLAVFTLYGLVGLCGRRLIESEPDPGELAHALWRVLGRRGSEYPPPDPTGR